MASYKNDASFKSAMAQYYQMSLTILQRDYEKIMNLEEVAENYAGKIKICKLDVDSNQESAQKYSIRGQSDLFSKPPTRTNIQ